MRGRTPSTPQALVNIWKSLKGVERMTMYFAEQNATHFLVVQLHTKFGACCQFLQLPAARISRVVLVEEGCRRVTCPSTPTRR
jgi:hypothetical protein